MSIKSWRQREQSEQSIINSQLKNKTNDDNSENWQIMSVRKAYMKNIQSEWIRKQSAVDNVLDKKDRTECLMTFCDWADRLSSWLQTDLENQNIAEFISQNNILWVS